MRRKVLYIYNPDTDDFERYHPDLRLRIIQFAGLALTGLALAAIFFMLLVYFFDSPAEESLRAENKELRANYDILNHRLENSLKIMEDIRSRDDNFYRVMMQIDPMTSNERFSGLEHDNRYSSLQKLSDSRLLTSLTQQIDYLDRLIYSQSKSLDELRDSVKARHTKMEHIPSIIPVKDSPFTLACGFGRRHDARLGINKLHTGLDFAAPTGTTVIATASGNVVKVSSNARYGNYIVIDHSYNYKTLYSNLGHIDVSVGQQIRKGDKIASVGQSGNSAAPHLHYEVIFKNEPQNPIDYCFQNLTPAQYNDLVRMSRNAAYIMD